MASPNAGPPDDASGAFDPEEVDARWADIVAELADLDDASARDGLEPRPDADGPGDAAPPAGPPTGPRPTGEPSAPHDLSRTFPVAPWVRPPPGPRDWPTTPEVEDLEEADSHFVPPEPPPLLGRDPLLTMAWSVVAGVPLVLLLLLVVVRPVPTTVAQVGGALFLAGLGVLLWRMPHRRDDDRGPGAVV